MGNRTKLVVSGAALGLAALLAGTARGGNAPVPTAQYFSVVLNAWEYVQYTGTSTDAVMLVDDISFSGRIPEGDATPPQNQYPYPPPGPYPGPGGQAPPILQTTDPIFRIPAFATIWGAQRSSDFAAQVWEIDSTHARVRQIDQFSHGTHSELAATFLGGRTPGWRDTIILPGTGDHPMGEDEAEHPTVDQFAMVGWAVPTSQSRHYQSPHIVPFGNKVSLEHPANATTWRRYAPPVVFVKGRIVEDGSLAPVEGTYAVSLLGITER